MIELNWIDNGFIENNNASQSKQPDWAMFYKCKIQYIKIVVANDIKYNERNVNWMLLVNIGLHGDEDIQ